MGNYMSCTLLTTPTMKSSRAARVILPSGEIRQFREPVKAAELMLESPNYFLVNSRSLNIGKRFSALSADEDLEFGNVYIMFPMKRVNSIISAADMAVVFMAANSAAKRISNGKVRILPELEAAAAAAIVSNSSSYLNESPAAGESRNLNSDIDDDVGGGFPGPEFRYRLAICRSKKPLLDTITEEPVRSR